MPPFPPPPPPRQASLLGLQPRLWEEVPPQCPRASSCPKARSWSGKAATQVGGDNTSAIPLPSTQDLQRCE